MGFGCRRNEITHLGFRVGVRRLRRLLFLRCAVRASFPRSRLSPRCWKTSARSGHVLSRDMCQEKVSIDVSADVPVDVSVVMGSGEGDVVLVGVEGEVAEGSAVGGVDGDVVAVADGGDGGA